MPTTRVVALQHLLQELHRELPRAQGREAEAQRANAKKDGRADGEIASCDPIISARESKEWKGRRETA